MRIVHRPQQILPQGISSSALEALEVRCLFAAGDQDYFIDTDLERPSTLGGYNDEVIYVQNDGKVLVASFDPDNSSGVHYAIRRFNPDGSPDNTFGNGDGNDNDGLAIIDVPFGDVADSWINSITVDASDRIVMGGLYQSTSKSDSDFVIVRLNSDGSLDETFDDVDDEGGVGGFAITNIGQISAVDAPDEITSVAIDSLGRIVAGGYTISDDGQEFAVARFDDEGTLDAGFNGSSLTPGMITFGFGGLLDADELREIAIDGSNNIIAGGDSISGLGAFSAVVARLTSAGELDATFDGDLGNGNGKIVYTIGGNSLICDVGLQSDGQIILAGLTFDVTSDAFVKRINATDGTDDVDFAGAGTTLIAYGQNVLSLSAVVDADDQIVATATIGDDSDVAAIARLDADGAADIVSSDPLPGMLSQTMGLAYGPDGNYYAVFETGSQLHLARYDGGGIVVEAPPTANAGPDQTVVRNQTITLSGSASGDDGFVLYEWDLDDNGSFETVGQVVTTSFSNAGVYEVNFRATDNDGQTAVDTAVIFVNATNQVGGTVFVGNSDAGGTVTITNGGGNVNVNGTPFSGVTEVVFFGGDGSDVVLVGATVNTPVELYGGAGSDLLTGGNGADLIIGGDGADAVSGGGGRDLVVGGKGSDLVVGAGGDDILVAGSTSYDANATALNAILAEWNSGRTYGQRVANIRDGSGTVTRLNGSFFLDSDVTVFDDGNMDIMLGGGNQDWFLYNFDSGALDMVLDRAGTEQRDDLDVVA